MKVSARREVWLQPWKSVFKVCILHTNSCNAQLLCISVYSWHLYPPFSEPAEKLGTQDHTIYQQESQIQVLSQLSPCAVTTAEHCFSLGLRNAYEPYGFAHSGVIAELSLHG